jgi:hypothetical protein
MSCVYSVVVELRVWDRDWIFTDLRASTADRVSGRGDGNGEGVCMLIHDNASLTVTSSYSTASPRDRIPPPQFSGTDSVARALFDVEKYCGAGGVGARGRRFYRRGFWGVSY